MLELIFKTEPFRTKESIFQYIPGCELKRLLPVCAGGYTVRGMGSIVAGEIHESY